MALGDKEETTQEKLARLNVLADEKRNGEKLVSILVDREAPPVNESARRSAPEAEFNPRNRKARHKGPSVRDAASTVVDVAKTTANAVDATVKIAKSFNPALSEDARIRAIKLRDAQGMKAVAKHAKTALTWIIEPSFEFALKKQCTGVEGIADITKAELKAATVALCEVPRMSGWYIDDNGIQQARMLQLHEFMAYGIGSHVSTIEEWLTDYYINHPKMADALLFIINMALLFKDIVRQNINFVPARFIGNAVEPTATTDSGNPAMPVDAVTPPVDETRATSTEFENPDNLNG